MTLSRCRVFHPPNSLGYILYFQMYLMVILRSRSGDPFSVTVIYADGRLCNRCGWKPTPGEAEHCRRACAHISSVFNCLSTPKSSRFLSAYCWRVHNGKFPAWAEGLFFSPIFDLILPYKRPWSAKSQALRAYQPMSFVLSR